MAETRVKSIRFDGNSCGKVVRMCANFPRKVGHFVGNVLYVQLSLPSSLQPTLQLKTEEIRCYETSSNQLFARLSSLYSAHLLPTFQKLSSFPKFLRISMAWILRPGRKTKTKKVFLVVCVSHTEYEGSTI